MKQTELGFDKALLLQPAAERLQHFKSYVAKHERLKMVDQKVTAVMREPAGASFMFVIGPTGIGKSTVLSVIYRRALQQAEAEMEADPGHIPIAGIELIPTGHKTYNWHDHWTRSLDALEEPLIKQKILPPRSPVERLTSGARLREQTAALRRSFEMGARMRRLRTFILDEAHHLTHVPATLLRYQLETVKSVANLSNALHIMFGTYEIALLRNASGQLGRRAVTVHFNRYQADVEGDVRAFAEVVQSFQHHMPLPIAPDLLPHLEYCFERSLGCVGILKDWFCRALAEAMEKNAKTITQRDLQRHELPTSVLLTISTEFIDGEERLAEEEDAFAVIKARLRIKPAAHRKKEGDKSAAKKATKKSKRRFGQRNPKRDKVGGGRAQS
jgi:hypothetical protein